MTTQSRLSLYWLDPRNPREPFPPGEHALRDPDGLLAVGGDLSVSRLLQAYRHGIFPWFNPDEPILWWTPNPRAVLQPSQLHISRSLRRAVNRADYAVTLDRAFTAVLEGCSEGRREGTWLGPAMRQAYTELFRRGFAHSIEVWRDGQLIGGLYGVALGKVFFGESMFSRASNGSKLAMVWLCRQLDAWQFALLDCQVASPHLERMGIQRIARNEFESILDNAIDAPLTPGGRWSFDIDVPNDPSHVAD